MLPLIFILSISFTSFIITLYYCVKKQNNISEDKSSLNISSIKINTIVPNSIYFIKFLNIDNDDKKLLNKYFHVNLKNDNTDNIGIVLSLNQSNKINTDFILNFNYFNEIKNIINFKLMDCLLYKKDIKKDIKKDNNNYNFITGLYKNNKNNKDVNYLEYYCIIRGKKTVFTKREIKDNISILDYLV